MMLGVRSTFVLRWPSAISPSSLAADGEPGQQAATIKFGRRGRSAGAGVGELAAGSAVLGLALAYPLIHEFAARQRRRLARQASPCNRDCRRCPAVVGQEVSEDEKPPSDFKMLAADVFLDGEEVLDEKPPSDFKMLAADVFLDGE